MMEYLYISGLVGGSHHIHDMDTGEHITNFFIQDFPQVVKDYNITQLVVPVDCEYIDYFKQYCEVILENEIFS